MFAWTGYLTRRTIIVVDTMLESCIIMKAQSCPLSGENPLIDLQIYFSMRFMMMMTKSELEKKSDLTDALHCTHKC